jgi:predicted dinucleotide-binding enzyme
MMEIAWTSDAAARGRQKLTRLARAAKHNAQAGTPADAVREADALLLAVHWSRVADVLKQAGDVKGKAIVTCTLPMNTHNTKLLHVDTTSGAEELARKVPRAKVVSAFGTVPSEVFFGVFDARRKAKRPSLAYCGDVDPGRRVRAGRRRSPAHRAVPGAVHDADGATRVRGRWRAGDRLSVRAIPAVTEAARD